MNRLLPILTFLFLTICFASAQTQQEMNRDAGQELEKADKHLNQVYQKLSKRLDAEHLEKLKAAQRLWLTFRDAHARLNASLVAEGGTMYPMIYAGTAARVTEERVKQLEELVSNASTSSSEPTTPE